MSKSNMFDTVFFPAAACDKPGGVCQDPKFVGGDGITFYFHGKKDRDFCLLSDPDLHINAHFIGKSGTASMTRDFTWVQSLAVLFGGSGHHHRLYLGAEKTAMWDDSVDRLAVAYDGLPIHLPNKDGATWQSSDSPATTITRSADANAVTVEVEGKLKITIGVVPITERESEVHNYGITKENCYAHLELGFKFYALTGEVDGVLGQTYRDGYVSRVKISAEMPVMGGEEKFSVSDLYAADCAVASFGREGGTGSGVGAELEEVRCASGISGSGIVCKK